MSTVVTVNSRGGGASTRCLVKGSPEAIGALLAPGASPDWYEATHRSLAERGMRVLALAYKVAEPAAASWARDQVEEGLQFAGFVAFACF
ncbi:hypothetical protein T492DRAFT_867082 [Pavlovales sp. CCMP2436]|nr:hypothetical protein T492DRAFT_867082 [Pavlovales sp. CCMP2436]